MNGIYSPRKIWDKEYFTQKMTAPKAAQIQKGFWERMGPTIAGAFANAVVPGSGGIAQAAVSGPEPITAEAPTNAVSGMQTNTEPVNIAGNTTMTRGPLGQIGQFNNQYNKPFDNEEYMRRFGGFNYA